MKRPNIHPVIVIGLFFLALLAWPALLAGQIAPAARYEGNWHLQPNGDVKITREFKLPMQLYRQWKDADVHMLEFRSFEAGRSNVDVTDKKAEWDDVNRTLTLKMTVLGLAKNMAGHWEAKVVPGLEFSNLDEGRRVAYFHFALDGPLGRVQGQDVITLPPQSTAPSWDESTRTVRYVMPSPAPAAADAPAEASTSRGLWWTLFAVCAAAALALLAASFAVKPKPAADSR